MTLLTLLLQEPSECSTPTDASQITTSAGREADDVPMSDDDSASEDEPVAFSAIEAVSSSKSGKGGRRGHLAGMCPSPPKARLSGLSPGTAVMPPSGGTAFSGRSNVFVPNPSVAKNSAGQGAERKAKGLGKGRGKKKAAEEDADMDSATEVSCGDEPSLPEGRGKSPFGGAGGGNAKSQAAISKAEKAKAKILTAEQLWHGKTRERQISAITQACLTAATKLHGLHDDEASIIAQEITTASGVMESQYQLFSKLKSDPSAAVSALDDADYEALMTCEISVLYTVLSTTAEELLKICFEKSDEPEKTRSSLLQVFSLCHASPETKKRLSTHALLAVSTESGTNGSSTAAATLQHQIIMMMLERVFRMKGASERLRDIVTTPCLQSCYCSVGWLLKPEPEAAS